MTGPLLALLVTLLVEVPLVALAYPGRRARMALVALAANTVTNLTLNVVLPGVPALHGHHLIVGEIFAVVGEAAAYAVASRPRDVGRALVVSGVANALSFGIGTPLVAFLLR